MSAKSNNDGKRFQSIVAVGILLSHSRLAGVVNQASSTVDEIAKSLKEHGLA